jgi:hypothetical protein
LWLNTASEVAFLCKDASNGAAVWTALNAGHPGYVAGRFYSTFKGIHLTTSAVPAADTFYLYPFVVQSKITVSSLNARAVTGGTTSAMKSAVWANKNGRPYGAPILDGSTGAATTSTPTNASNAVSGTLHPGVYWVGSKHTGSPLPQFTSASQTSYAIEEMIGRTNMNGSTGVMGLSIAATYSSATPTFDGTETWTDVQVAGIPIMRLGL